MPDVDPSARPAGFAVVGMACKFPGARNLYEFWTLLDESRDPISLVPASRWDWREYYEPGGRSPGTINSRWGGFVEDLELFDAKFFGLDEAEARRLDPQQRLVLETAWHALEHAGILPAHLSGSGTAVYMGVSHSDHGRKLNGVRFDIDGKVGPHHYHCFAANRLSYFLDLKGPSFSLDAACVSSALALHQATQALACRETDLAIVGGVNAHLLPEESIYCTKANLLSGDGRCRSFDHAGDGFVRSEGCGIVLLTRMEDAIRDRRRVLACVESVAINHSGLTNGIGSPSGPAQRAVMQAALSRAGVSADQITFVEAHGSGTIHGDAAEMRAIQAVFGRERRAPGRCHVGCVKTNVGHLEAAAGMASLIKVILALGHEKIPANLHFERISPSIDLNGTAVDVIAAPIAWRADGTTRYAGINAFGFGGANSHIVISDRNVSRRAPADGRRSAGDVRVLKISARSEYSLKRLAADYRDRLAADSADFDGLCHTANLHRQEFDHRLALVAESAPQMARELDRFVADQLSPAIHAGRRKRFQAPAVVLSLEDLSIAEGQWLYRSDPAFARFLATLLERSLGSEEDRRAVRDQIEGPADRPANAGRFFIVWGAVEYLRSCGVKVEALAGQGVGEIVSACQLGACSAIDVSRILLAGEDRGSADAVTGEVREAIAGGPEAVDAPSHAIGEFLYADGRNALITDAAARGALPACKLSPLHDAGTNARLVVCLRAGDGTQEAATTSGGLRGLSLNRESRANLQLALAVCYAQGANIDWRIVEAGSEASPVDAPLYPFDAKRLWYEVDPSLVDHRAASGSRAAGDS